MAGSVEYQEFPKMLYSRGGETAIVSCKAEQDHLISQEPEKGWGEDAPQHGREVFVAEPTTEIEKHFVPYPRMVYHAIHGTAIVKTENEHVARRDEGWQDAPITSTSRETVMRRVGELQEELRVWMGMLEEHIEDAVKGEAKGPALVVTPEMVNPPLQPNEPSELTEGQDEAPEVKDEAPVDSETVTESPVQSTTPTAPTPPPPSAKYTCAICKKGFERQGEWKDHMSSVHPARPRKK